MADSESIPRLDGAILQSVVVVDRIVRTEAKPFQSVSLPGHLVHVVTAGRVEQRSAGVVETIGAGDSVWYYENELIEGRILETPWTFYTVNFVAPTLAPPARRQRVRPFGDRVIDRMDSLLQIWRETDAPATARHMRIHSLLLEILVELLPESSAGHRIDSPTELWWEIESTLRADLSCPIDLRHLQRLSGRSQRSIIRACHAAVGMSPMKRVKQIRLSYAQGLVLHSELPMTEIALRVGYGRVQEFSRDYRKHFGITPTQDRRSGPRYRNSD